MLTSCIKKILVPVLLALPCAVFSQSGLIDALTQDQNLQDSVIIAMRNALGAPEQASVVRRGPFTFEVQFYIATYRNIHDANTLANIQKRYNAVRAELLEPQLPKTVDVLVSLLEMLPSNQN